MKLRSNPMQRNNDRKEDNRIPGTQCEDNRKDASKKRFLPDKSSIIRAVILLSPHDFFFFFGSSRRLQRPSVDPMVEEDRQKKSSNGLSCPEGRQEMRDHWAP